MCRKLCAFPEGFELDHKVPLYLGGADTDENCQVLCVGFATIEGKRVKTGCHAQKTSEDALQ
ncbi:HNH endonuclease signature motif containing protein [Pseudomonas nitroreducens]|nr:HNH endonuclease signature motif containing protein [Pseudomonas nitroreducens]